MVAEKHDYTTISIYFLCPFNIAYPVVVLWRSPVIRLGVLLGLLKPQGTLRILFPGLNFHFVSIKK